MNCPACNKTIPDASLDCVFCGVIFEKWKARQASLPPAAKAVGTAQPSPQPSLLATSRLRKINPVLIYSLLLIPFTVILFLNKGRIQCLQTRAFIMMQGKYTPKDFYEFVGQGDLEEVRYFLKAGMSPNTTFKEEPVLLAAIQANGLEVFKELLNQGADPNKTGRQGVTPLMVAVGLAQQSPSVATDMVRALLQKGADPNEKNEKGLTALTWATVSGEVELISLLSGGDPDQAAANTAMSPMDSLAAYNKAMNLIKAVATTRDEKAYRELASMGTAAAAALISELDNKNTSTHGFCIQLLSKTRPLPKDAQRKFKSLLADPGFFYKKEAAQALANTEPDKGAKAQLLIEYLTTNDQTFLMEIVRILGDIGPSAKPALSALRQAAEKYPALTRTINITIDKIAKGAL